MLRAMEISKGFAGASGPVQALDAVTLSVGAGEAVAVRGASGSGKTTLLLALGGLLRPDGGSVRLAGDDLYAMAVAARARIRGERIGFLFQQYHLLPYLTVEENVQLRGVAEPVEGGAERARELITRLGLSERAGHRPGALSAGERQRAALARALFARPAVVLADEPTGNLDEVNAKAVLEVLREHAALGGAVVVATHDEKVAVWADRVAVMERGRLTGGEVEA